MAGAVSLELLREQLLITLAVSSQDLVGRGRRSTMLYMNNIGTAGKPFNPLLFLMSKMEAKKLLEL